MFKLRASRSPSVFRQLLPPSLAQLLPVLMPWSQQASDAGGQSHTLASSLYAPDAVERIGRAQSFPLRLMQADVYSAPRVALIGCGVVCVVVLAEKLFLK